MPTELPVGTKVTVTVPASSANLGPGFELRFSAKATANSRSTAPTWWSRRFAPA